MNLTVTYLLWSLFLLLILGLVISVWIYAKWQHYGPKWKRFKTKLYNKFHKEGRTLEKSKRGAVVSQPGMGIQYIDGKEVINNSNPQELLRLQIDEEILLKQAQIDTQKKLVKQKNKKRFFLFKRKTKKQSFDEENKITQPSSIFSQLEKKNKSGLDWGGDQPSIELKEKDQSNNSTIKEEILVELKTNLPIYENVLKNESKIENDQKESNNDINLDIIIDNKEGE